MQISPGRLWPIVGVYATRKLANYIFMSLPSAIVQSRTPFSVTAVLFVHKRVRKSMNSSSGLAFLYPDDRS